MSMANRHGQGAVFTIGLMYSQLFSCWFHLNNQMLVLRPSMVDIIIHFDPSCPPPRLLSLLWILFGNCAKSKMLAPSVFRVALWMDMLPETQCPEYTRITAYQWTPEVVLVYNCLRRA